MDLDVAAPRSPEASTREREAFAGIGHYPTVLEAVGEPRGFRVRALLARAVSVAAHCTVTASLVVGARAAYHALTDSFVAPLILTPDSDVVIQSKLTLSRLLAEREALLARREEARASSEAASKGIESLRGLSRMASGALDWSTLVTANQAESSAHQLQALSEKRSLVSEMIARQEARVAQLRIDADSGLTSRADVAREELILGELRLALLQNERDTQATSNELRSATLAQRALSRPGTPGTPATPEMLMRQEQLVKLELEVVRLEAEVRGKTSQLEAADQGLAQVDELIGQLKARPIYRAIESSQNVAFVPYTQLEGVRAGGTVYDCVWGLFACRAVGKVSEVLPGEVALMDPWGTPARGQYALLELSDASAAQSKTLRVRDTEETGEGLADARR